MPTLKTELPRYYGTQRRPGLVRIKAEEEAIIWLWAKPSIFPWQRPRAWLFPPVTGKTRWPGDLWGIDSCGDLVIRHKSPECVTARRLHENYGNTA
jgi:hypothetical protein